MSVPIQQARWILFAICVLILAINIDYTSVNLALVSMAADVDSDLNIIQWALSGYVLAWGAFVVFAGRLADIFGKRRILLYGVTIFALASAFIGVGQSIEVIIAGRVLQGFGGALFVPSLYALTFSSFPTEKHGFAIGIVGGAAGIGLAIGPSFSGFLLEYFSWRWIFLINIPLSILTMLVIILTTQSEPKRILKDKVDLTGASLLGAALPICIYALNEIGDHGLQTQSFMFGLVGLVLFVGFFTHLKKSDNPLIPLSLFRNSAYLKGCMLPYMAHQFTFSLTLVLMGLYLQNVLNYPAFESGLIFMAMTLGFGLLSIYGGALVDRAGLQLPSILGLSITSIAMTSMVFLSPESSLIFVVGVLMVAGIGLGFCLSSYNTAMMQAVDSSQVTLASSVFAMAALVSHTLAIVISSGMITTIGLAYAQSELSSLSLTAGQMHQVSVIVSSANRSADLFLLFSDRLKPMVEAAVNNGFMFALHVAVLLCAFLTAVGAMMTRKYMHIKVPVSSEDAVPAIAA